MNNNDRINAYKHAFNFQPEKLSSEEVAKKNAEIESLQKPKTDAALAALLASSQPVQEEEEKPEFKPFSFDNAPVFKSIDDNDNPQENQNQQKQEQQNSSDNSNKDEPKEEDDFWHQRDAMLNKASQTDGLGLPSITPPPPKQEAADKAAEPEADAQLSKPEIGNLVRMIDDLLLK